MAAARPSGLLLPPIPSLLLLLAVATSVVAQAEVRNVTLGSTLDETTVWASPSGDFAFGFYPLDPQNNTFLLGIWFDNIPERTLVWYAADANGAKLVRRGSKVQLTTDSRLVLNNHMGEQVWAATSGGVEVAYAAMLDSGNFVLSSNASAFRWESFNFPVDTILPTQVMNWGGTLSSRRKETDYSVGRFQLRLLSDGNLVLNTIDLQTKFAYEAYWRSDTYKSGQQVVFNRTGEIYVVNEDGSTKKVLSAGFGSPEDLYQRATLDHDGVVRLYVYPKKASGAQTWPAGRWSIADYIPGNICLSLLVQIDSGPCGYNSYCRLENGSPVCECPPGFSPIDPADMITKGCRANYVGQGCNPDGSPLEGEDMFFLEERVGTNWSTSDYALLTPIDEVSCRRSCLADCLCAVAIYGSNQCWKKKMPLSNGQVDPRSGSKALIKVAKMNSSSTPFLLPSPDTGRPKRGALRWRLLPSVFLGISVFVNFFLLLAAMTICLRYTQARKLPLWQRVQPGASLREAHLHLLFFSYKELEIATGKFQEELGKGSFGVVYRGALEFDGRMVPVAVKKLHGMEKEGEQEFRTEVKAIGQTHHRNLVRLLGFCDEGSHRLLVYELMSNGSLAEHLFANGKERPSWDQRVHIAFGVARGLLYLHEECTAQIIHCDIKPQNVLLDGDLTPRISDFGLAKLLQNNHSKTNTAIRGTRGYVAPEWFRNMPISSKVDVYSFGVLLVELICCRRNVPSNASDARDVILTDLAYNCFKYGQPSVLAGEDEEAIADSVRLVRLVKVALWCVQEEPSLRPSMRMVTQMLEGAVEVSVPPDPSSFISKTN